jgi:hypothetical protein
MTRDRQFYRCSSVNLAGTDPGGILIAFSVQDCYRRVTGALLALDNLAAGGLPDLFLTESCGSLRQQP